MVLHSSACMHALVESPPTLVSTMVNKSGHKDNIPNEGAIRVMLQQDPNSFAELIMRQQQQ